MPTPKRLFAIAILLCLGFTASCGSDDDGPAPIDVETPNADRCEILDPSGSECLLPFPSDALTVADDATDTGRRVHFARESMPANASGVHVDPTEWNRNDGFSPGAQIALLVRGVDPAASGLPPVTDVARSLETGSNLVLLDVDAGERVLAWAELDSHATDPARRLLLILPARSLREGRRHVVALRGLADGAGETIEAGEVFRVFRDSIPTTNPAIEERRPAMERIFADLDSAGVPREELFLAWDFTVASERSLSERLLHIRDGAFGALGDEAPAFTVTQTSESATSRSVIGTFIVPRYLTGDGSPGSTFDDDGSPDALPRRNGDQSANLICVVPTGASPENPSRLMLYGHGLLGSAAEVLGVGQIAALVNVTSCATDWIGMSTGDIPNVLRILQDLSTFRSQADRLQQGHLNFLFLGRLMKHPEGLGSHPAFQKDGQSVLDGSDLFLLGASQGGILGGATSAVAQDWTRAVLAVGGANYSLLIPRSVDFDEFEPVLAQSYPDALVRRLGFGLTQMLWDRGEANAYLQHLTRDPYRETPVKDILYFMAFADHQVANVATEVAARTIDARVREPALRPGRSSAVQPFYGMEPVPSYPWPGSALVVWDFGTPPPPDENVPPREGEDPHGKASEVPEVLVLVSEYLRTGGALVDVCGGVPCTTLE
ncbi:MAG: hypothetical protein FJ144_19040 [Deltaproteobacteria bacterium]|nr:hypothetical protein [Deltaproteobacteria bacterium]